MQVEHREETFRFSRSCLYVSSSLALLLGVIVYCLLAKYHVALSRSKSFAWSYGIAFFVGAVGMQILIIFDWCERYFLSLKTDCIIYPKRRWGMWGVRKTVPLDEIVEIKVEQGCVQRYFNVGNVVFQVGAMARKKIRVAYLCNPEAIVESIRKRQAAISIKE